MTTCIWDGVSKVYCDTQSTGTRMLVTRKYHILDDGNAIMLGAGLTSDIHKFRYCIGDKRIADITKHTFSDFEKGNIKGTVIIIIKDGTILEDGKLKPNYRIQLYDNSVDSITLPNQLMMIGSGGKFAKGALDAGASIMQAMKIAADNDVYTNNIIECYDLSLNKEITL